MASNDVVERVTAAIDDYYLEHRVPPRRITVSQEVARKLNVAQSARQEEFGPALERPRLLAHGHAMWIRGILVVVDMDNGYTVDIR